MISLLLYCFTPNRKQNSNLKSWLN